ncbi:phage tail protein [Paenibacillus lutrae]|uniref:Phage tail protein n=1 Tax=Paenibacillus lutrae TaxID=2078573 RepID=A0A7X3K0E0_9BACL|nr:tail fiber protein [Paenibacillus lutrae]MVP00985.1 phage tail protein [Paenibacillus lutrae]
MSDCYLGEIRMFAGNFAPRGWALCNGQVLSIAEYEALYVLLGTTYGGDGQTTFALPDLQGRVPIHKNPTYPWGNKGGTETVTLTSNQLASHTHIANANSTLATDSTPQNNVWSTSSSRHFASGGPGITPVNMNNQALSSVGGNQPHDNVMPSLTISFIIALEGVFPSQP